MRNRYILLGDMLIIAAAAMGAFVLRFDWFFASYRSEFVPFLFAALVAKPVVFIGFGIYNRYWRYASIGDLIALGLAVSIASVMMGVLAVGALYGGIIENFSRTVVLLDALLTLMGTGAFRLTIRVLWEARSRADTGQRKEIGPRRVLIAGAGDAGTVVVRELQRNPQLGMLAVGFVDDDHSKIGKRIYGVDVLGSTSDLPEIIRSRAVQEVAIAMPTAPGKRVRYISEQCLAAGVKSRIMPGIYELLDGNVSVSRLRNVDIADLLRRSQVDWRKAPRTYLRQRSVLITGAGGSIGLELCRQVASAQPLNLTLLGHGENSLFEAETHLKQFFPHVPLTVVVADIRDRSRIEQVFNHVRPQVVIHAAAHKHVPMMEDNPEEAISNNVLGTLAVVDAAIAAGASHFVFISSDKAVAPTSIMGASKRIAEAVVRRAASRANRSFVVVRFGNVLGSRGSAVPIFTKQIERGGPVTITDPEMRRFFMTIPEAVHLVLEAGGLGSGGELFVLKMGDPIRIVDLVQDLIRLSGADDVPIEFTGIRPGEKLLEALWDDGATSDATLHPEIMSVTEPPIVSDEVLLTALAELSEAVMTGNRAALLAIVGRLIPTLKRESAGGGTDRAHLGVVH